MIAIRPPLTAVHADNQRTNDRFWHCCADLEFNAKLRDDVIAVNSGLERCSQPNCHPALSIV